MPCNICNVASFSTQNYEQTVHDPLMQWIHEWASLICKDQTKLNLVQKDSSMRGLSILGLSIQLVKLPIWYFMYFSLVNTLRTEMCCRMCDTIARILKSWDLNQLNSRIITFYTILTEVISFRKWKISLSYHVSMIWWWLTSPPFQ